MSTAELIPNGLLEILLVLRGLLSHHSALEMLDDHLLVVFVLWVVMNKILGLIDEVGKDGL